MSDVPETTVPVFNPNKFAKNLLNIPEFVADMEATASRVETQVKLVKGMIADQAKASKKATGEYVMPEGFYAGIFLLGMNEKLNGNEYFDFFARAFAAVKDQPYFSKFAMYQAEDGTWLPQIEVFAETDTLPQTVVETAPLLDGYEQVFIVKGGLEFRPKPAPIDDYDAFGSYENEPVPEPTPTDDDEL